jgi:hypothetical protein
MNTWGNVGYATKKERKKEGRENLFLLAFFHYYAFSAFLHKLPDFYFQPVKRHFFTIMHFRHFCINCRISISSLKKGISKVFFK